MTYIIIESALGRAEVREDIDALDALEGSGGAAEAISISYFKGPVDPIEIDAVDPDNFLGQLILINYKKPGSPHYTHSYVFEAIIRSPAHQAGGSRLLNNYSYLEGEFSCIIKAKEFFVPAIYYCQQNSRTHVCAHACLRMALNTLDTSKKISSKNINDQIKHQLPSQGLMLQEIVDSINANSSKRAHVIDCGGLNPQTYVASLASIVESGHMALLVFTTNQSLSHVVTVYGHTRNSDQWHPEAIPAYGGSSSALYYPSSAWISHFLIHDDNFGPYLTLSSRALDSDPAVKANWIIAVLPETPAIPSHAAEMVASSFLMNSLASMRSLASGKWFSHITKANNQKYVLRTILINRDDYLQHLRSSKGHTDSGLDASEIALLSGLPDSFWMVEYTLPHLYTGNRSKLGEVIVNTNLTQGGLTDYILAVRLPSLILIPSSPGVFSYHPSSLDSHSAVYRPKHHGHEW